MEKISVNRNEIVNIRNKLDKSAEALESLLNAVESCLLEEDWASVKILGTTLAKAINKVGRILDSDEEREWFLVKVKIIFNILL